MKPGGIVLLAAALTLGAARVQAQDGVRVIRRADRRALIIKLGRPLPNTKVGVPLDVSHAILVDLTRQGMPVALEPTTDITVTGCPTSRHLEYPEDQVCVVVAGGVTLDDTHQYSLTVDSSVVAARQVSIEPVGGRVVAPTRHPVEDIVVQYDVDLSHDSTLALVLTFGHDRPVTISSPRLAGEPLCYTRGGLEFDCNIDTRLHRGDSIQATFVRLDGDRTPVPTGKIAPTRDTISDAVNLAAKDTTAYDISVAASYAQSTASRTGTVTALWRNMPFYHIPWRTAYYHDSFSPYVDLLWTTDRKTAGYINLGVQYSGYLWQYDGPLQTLGLFVTPRTETDKKATVGNFMYLDAELRPGIRGLYTGSLPLDGHYRILPHAGIELGHTILGRSVAHPESDDPSRWKAGVTVIATWPGSTGDHHTGVCAWLGCGGASISADWQHYFLNKVPLPSDRTNFDWATITAVYKFTAHVGVSAALKNGECPPLFTYTRLIQLGLAVVY